MRRMAADGSKLAQRSAITPVELMAEIDAGKAPVVVDVRSRAEYDAGHVPGALHVPFWQVSAHASSLPRDRETPLVVYCGHGPRAYLAGVALRRLGFSRVKYLTGHMSRWKEEGLREER
jgi:rhodanese-related sulfurtransferase